MTSPLSDYLSSADDESVDSTGATGPDAGPEPVADGALGRRIVEAREAQGWSRSDLATRLGVREETVTKWEAGRTNPRANRLTAVAGLTGVSVSWLLMGQGIEPDQGAVDLGTVRDELADVSRELAALAERVRNLQSRLNG